MIQEEQLSDMVKEYRLSTGKSPLGGLQRNSAVGTTDRPDMTSVVYHGRKGTDQNKQNQKSLMTRDRLFIALLV